MDVKYKVAPLPASFMATSIIGFVVVTIYTIYGRFDLTWGFAMDLIFVLMFISSVVSITPNFPKELD